MATEPLTTAERERFATVLEEDALSRDNAIEQMERINAPSSMTKFYRAEAMAMRVVAKMLRQIHKKAGVR